MLNSHEGWAINLRNLRAVWCSQCQVPCLHLRDFRPDLGQIMVDAIVSCLPKNTESTITILGYRHVNLGSTLLLTFLRMGRVFAWKWHPHKSTKTTKMATAVTWGYLMKDFSPWGGSYEPPRQKTCGWHVWRDRMESQSRRSTSNSQFVKVPRFFLIVKIITVFELVPFHTYFTQSVELIHQN